MTTAPTFVITGASRGIGKYLFRRLKDEGRVVFGTYRTTEPDSDVRTHYVQVDITDANQLATRLSPVFQRASRLCLVNCAGTNYNAMAHKSDVAEWAKTLTNNLTGTFHVINAALPFMRAAGYGRIINLSSVVAQMGVPGTSAYAASKSGLWGMTRSIAVENASKGITINNLNLGYFSVGMIEEIPVSLREPLRQKIPQGDFGNPENILQAVMFLLNSEYTTGSSIDINGGLV